MSKQAEIKTIEYQLYILKISLIFFLVLMLYNTVFSLNVKITDLKKITTDQIISVLVYKENKLYYFNNEGLCEYDLKSNTRNIVFVYGDIKTENYYIKSGIIIKEGDKIGKIALNNEKSIIGFKANFYNSNQYNGRINEELSENNLFYDIKNKKLQNNHSLNIIDGWSFNDNRLIFHAKYDGGAIIGYSYWDILDDTRIIANDNDPGDNVSVQNNGNIIAYSSGIKVCTEDIDYGVSKKTDIPVEGYLLWSPDNKYLFQLNSRGIKYCDLVKQRLSEAVVFDEAVFNKLDLTYPIWPEDNKIFTISNNDIYEINLKITKNIFDNILAPDNIIKDNKKKTTPIHIERVAANKKEPNRTNIRINDYIVMRERGVSSVIEIRKNDIIVYKNKKLYGNLFFDGDCIGLVGEEGCVPKAGECITGDGIPNLVIGWWTGGAYCCSKYLILSLGDEIKVLNYIYNGCSALLFKDIDKDKSIELIGRDWKFQEFWWSGDKDFIAPIVIWKFVDGKYEISTKLMKKTTPTEREMKEYSLKYKQEKRFESFLIHYLLDLVYSGNGDKIDKFYDIFAQINTGVIEYLGNNPKENKLRFLENFKENLRKSEYWGYIKALNKWD
jgi:hypothetical protein